MNALCPLEKILKDLHEGRITVDEAKARTFQFWIVPNTFLIRLLERE